MPVIFCDIIILSCFFRFYKSDIPPTDLDTEDCDVATERYRVELATLKAYYNMDYSGDNNKAEGGGVGEGPGEVEQDTLQVLGLVKQYRAVLGARVAVNNVTFGVKRGQVRFFYFYAIPHKSFNYQ